MSATGHFTLSNLTTTNIEVDTIGARTGSNILPFNADVSLGSIDRPFKDLYVSESTIYLGDTVELGVEDSGGTKYFAPRAPMKIGSIGSADTITLDSTNGIQFGSSQTGGKTTKITKSGIELTNDVGDIITVDDQLFTRVDERVDTLAKSIAIDNSTKADFGFLIDYKLIVNAETMDVEQVINGNFELGRLFDKTDSLGLNTLIYQEMNDLPTFTNDGSVTLYSDANTRNKLNPKLNDNAIRTQLTNTDRFIVPIETNTNLRDIFPINIFDLNKAEGRIKFKSDFDSMGSLYFSTDGIKLSGLHTLKNFAQVSHPKFYAQSTTYDGSIITLSPYESVVDFITYYQLPVLFENAQDVHEKYEYYLSSTPQNRLNDKAYVKDTFENSTESVYDQSVTIQQIKLEDYRKDTGLSPNPTLYPAIRIIKWKNTYTPTFTKLTKADIDTNTTFSQNLGWGTLPNVSDIYTKYNAKGWIKKLVEITFAYIKYGQPLKLLGTIDTETVNTIYNNLTTDKLALHNNTDSLSVTIDKSVFSSHI